MKKYTVIVLGLALLTLPFYVSAMVPVTPDCGTDLETLNVGTHVGVPPFEYLDASGMLVGFDVKVACELRKRLGYNNLTFVNSLTFWDETAQNSFLPSLRGGVFAMSISALNEINTDSLETAAYVKYSDATQGLLFNGPVPEGVTPENALQFLANQQLAIIVLRDSAENGLLREGIIQPNPQVVTTSSVARMIEHLNVLRERGRLAAIFTIDAVVNFQANLDSSFVPLNNVTVPENSRFKSRGLGIQIHPTCCQLYANVRQAVADMEADGTLKKLRDEFKTGPFTPADFTPASCKSTVPNLPKRNDIAQFIFDKYCKCIFDVKFGPVSQLLINEI